MRKNRGRSCKGSAFFIRENPDDAAHFYLIEKKSALLYAVSMNIPVYPAFEPLSLAMKSEFHPALNMQSDGISEFTFAGLYLFRDTYHYEVARLPDKGFIIKGIKNGERFVLTPCCLPPNDLMDELFKEFAFLKNMSESQCKAERIRLEMHGFYVMEDRDNFDYYYNREDLAELTGKTYHKKRNLVNAFLNNYHYEQRNLCPETKADAFYILDKWREDKEEDGDYKANKESIELYRELELKGSVFYVEGEPAGLVIGEPLAKARMFAVHFEKGLSKYKGIYQFVNQAFAQTLPRTYHYINREQDLGDPGLRQAKMTYRPAGFVKKYRVYPTKPEGLMPEADLTNLWLASEDQEMLVTPPESRAD